MDMEKVIKSLKWFRDRDKWREGIMIHDDHAEVRKQICDNAIELLKEQHGTIYKKQDDIDRLCNEIAKLKHRLHDKWTGTWEWISDDEYRCSECGNKTCVDECMEEPQYLYCPYCGSKMTFAGRN